MGAKAIALTHCLREQLGAVNGEPSARGKGGKTPTDEGTGVAPTPTDDGTGVAPNIRNDA